MLKHALPRTHHFKALTVGLSGLISQFAYASVSIGSGGGTGFDFLTRWLQNFVDFISGPFGLAAVIISAILAFVTWSVMPKEGIIGPLMRVVVSAIVIINLGTWIYTFSA